MLAGRRPERRSGVEHQHLSWRCLLWWWRGARMAAARGGRFHFDTRRTSPIERLAAPPLTSPGWTGR